MEGNVMAGRVVHFEVPFDDEQRARDFYSAVFGWTTQSIPEMGGYVMAFSGPSGDAGPTEPGYINGGMFQRSQTLAGPMITIEVDDIEAALEQAVAHGGSVVQGKQEVGDMGFTGYVKDSEGNCVGLWASAPGG
jgi:predicted enzyme related to lactoylglutathione lyase